MFIPVSLTLRMLRQEDYHKVEVSLGFKMNLFRASLWYRNTTHTHTSERKQLVIQSSILGNIEKMTKVEK